HLGPLPARGSITFATRLSGPYADLKLESSAALHDFHFLELSLGDVSAQVGFSVATMDLLLDQIRGKKDRSSYQGRSALGLKSPEVPIEAHLEMPDAYVHDLVDLAVGLVPTLSSVNDIKDVDGRVAGVIDVKGPVAGPEGTAALKLADLRMWGQGF